jgi:chromosomal replication initiator protein
MQLIFDFPVNPRYTLDNFVVCPGNATALMFARRLLTEDGENLLYLHGPEGSGKTHLLQALAVELAGESGHPCYLTCGELERLYGGAYQAEGESPLAAHFRQARALVVDDLQLLPAVASVRQEFWQLFNDFHGAGRTIAVAGPCPPRELANIDEHISSRLLWGLVAPMDISDDASRRLILEKLARDRQVVLPSEVAEFLINRLRRDIPTLAAALDILHAKALVEQRKITLPFARRILAHLL